MALTVGENDTIIVDDNMIVAYTSVVFTCLIKELREKGIDIGESLIARLTKSAESASGDMDRKQSLDFLLLTFSEALGKALAEPR